MSARNPFPVMANDCDLFEQDLFPSEFEYFCKHTQAFRSMWLEKTVGHKVDFVEEFFNYSENYGYIRDFPLKMSSKKKYFNSAREFLIENFAKAKVSAAKSVIQQITHIASNKEKILQLGSIAKSKDPFYMKETRDTFRRFFGQPGDPDTWKRTVANMPLYTRFSGAVCRVLRRWVEGYTVVPEFVKKRYPFEGCFGAKDGKIIAEFLMQKLRPDSSMRSERKVVPESDSMSSESSSVDAGKNDGSDGTESVNEKEEEAVNRPGVNEKEEEAVNRQGVNEKEEEAVNRLGIGEWSTDKKHEAEKDEKPDVGEKSTTRRHHCSCCRAVEPQAKLYKKCALCKGKGTRFYCSKSCQTEDWLRRHKQYHIDRGIQ